MFRFRHLLLPLILLLTLTEAMALVQLKMVGNTRAKRMDPVLKIFNETIGKENGFKVLYHYDKLAVSKAIKEGKAKELKYDLIQIPDASLLGSATSQNFLLPLESSVLRENVPEHLRSKEGTWYGFTKKARGLFYNSDLVKPYELDELLTYEDLGNPNWKGRLCLRTSESLYNISLIAFFVDVKGKEATEAMLKEWINNKPLIKKSDMSGVLQALHEGECHIGVANTYYLGHFRKKYEKTPIKMVFPNQDSYGAHINLRSFGVHKLTNHPHFSKRVLEFLTSERAQDLITQGNSEFGGSFEYPVNPKVKLRGFVKEVGQFKENKKFNLEIKALQNEKAKEIARDLGWK